MKPTKANARRWFDAREGCEVATHQVRPDGRMWVPGPRTITRKGTDRWSLDGSEFRLSRDHVVVGVYADRLVLDWLDSDGVTIHTTIYKDVTEE